MKHPQLLRFTGPRSVAVIAGVLVLMLGLGSGAAYAFIRGGSGSGGGTAKVSGAPSAVTIATNATAGALLQPGGTGDLVITATNPNSSAVKITALTLGTVTGCTTPALTFNSGVLPVTIPANASNLRIDISGALTMGTTASNDCQGATLTIPVTPTVEQ
jgi:hypothetical protein